MLNELIQSLRLKKNQQAFKRKSTDKNFKNPFSVKDSKKRSTSLIKEEYFDKFGTYRVL